MEINFKELLEKAVENELQKPIECSAEYQSKREATLQEIKNNLLISFHYSELPSVLHEIRDFVLEQVLTNTANAKAKAMEAEKSYEKLTQIIK